VLLLNYTHPLDQAYYCLIVHAGMSECSLPFYLVHSMLFDSLDQTCHFTWSIVPFLIHWIRPVICRVLFVRPFVDAVIICLEIDYAHYPFT
jgi:hypothetical protein